MNLKVFKAGIFAVADFEAMVNVWLETPEIRVISKHVTGLGDVYVFYETISDKQHRQNWQTIEENADLEKCLDIARTVKQDEQFFDLKNGQQREIYLLHKYGINSKQSDIVRELLRPEMAAVLTGKDKEVRNP